MPLRTVCVRNVRYARTCTTGVLASVAIVPHHCMCCIVQACAFLCALSLLHRHQPSITHPPGLAASAWEGNPRPKFFYFFILGLVPCFTLCFAHCYYIIFVLFVGCSVMSVSVGLSQWRFWSFLCPLLRF